tara:strand:+ start:2084 stop:2257 length:174 start_codon:yes stop_codon:yes gene_type:complete
MLKSFIKTELDKLFKTDYYGTEEQIENENFIAKESNVEPLYNENIEEWYLRIYDATE